MKRKGSNQLFQPTTAYWRGVSQKLSKRYNDPLHGNHSDPLDELIYIVLSAKTRLSVLRPVFGQLKTKYPRWEDALRAGRSRFKKAIQPLGLANTRSAQIFGILSQIKHDHGEVSLDFLQHFDNDEIEEYLTSLPGVGLKTARCVMLYSLGRRTFPADIHTLRLFHYLGITKKRLRHDTGQDVLQNLVPQSLRFKLHVNIVAHGQQTCLPRFPKCPECVLRSICHRNLIEGND